MKISSLSSQLKFVNRIGQTLSVEESMALEASVLELGCEYHFEELHFWGRVQGILKNYYVVQGVNLKGVSFPAKKYFWSSQDFRFAELPAPRHEEAAKVQQMGDYFTGQHEKILLRSSDERKKAFQLNGEELLVKQKHFTQLDRLSLVVHLVDQVCQAVPLGAYRMIPTHELIRNPNFKGLPIANSKSLNHYVHLRAPTHHEKKMLIECNKAIERDDFMDSLDMDPIHKSWSVQSDESNTEITLRSLLWPGYVGYHRTNSSIFRGVYMGTGIKSQDLQFLL